MTVNKKGAVPSSKFQVPSGSRKATSPGFRVQSRENSSKLEKGGRKGRGSESYLELGTWNLKPLPSVSRLLCVGLPAEPEEAEALKLYEKYPPGMVILFAHNIRSGSQVRALCRTIHDLPGNPLIVIDQEGGRVNRLKGLFGDLPGAAEYGSRPLKKIEALAREWGACLADLGVDADFAPVADVGPAAAGTGLEGRTLGDTPEEVIPRARAFIRGLHLGGVYSCIKHFPGLGASTLDSHQHLPRMDLGLRRMQRHLRPFRALKSDAPMVMVAHGVYPALDASETPSSLSRPVISLLNRRPAYRGLIVSDDLEMGALKRYGSLTRRAELSLKAGCHMVIISHEWRIIPDIVRRLQRVRIDAALTRFDAWRATPLSFWHGGEGRP